MFNRLNINPQLILGIFFCFLWTLSRSQKLDHKRVFQSGEKANYSIYYNWGFIWVEAGTVQFSVNELQYKNQTCYKFLGIGKTLPKWDWMYKVRDSYKAITDTSKNLVPLYFERQVLEGSTQIHNTYYFNKEKQIIDCFLANSADSTHKIIEYEENLSDVISMIYQARLMKFEAYEVNDKLPLNLLLDGKAHQTYIRYLGREIVELKDGKKINCFKFKPMLIEGTIFKAGEDMTVWVSEDLNRLPVKVETPILVGSIKVKLRKVENLIRPLSFISPDN